MWAVSAKDNNKHVNLAFQTYNWNAANTKKKLWILTSKVSETHHNLASKQKAVCVTSISALDVMTTLVLYIEKCVLPEVL